MYVLARALDCAGAVGRAAAFQLNSARAFWHDALSTATTPAGRARISADIGADSEGWALTHRSGIHLVPARQRTDEGSVSPTSLHIPSYRKVEVLKHACGTVGSRQCRLDYGLRVPRRRRWHPALRDGRGGDGPSLGQALLPGRAAHERQPAPQPREVRCLTLVPHSGSTGADEVEMDCTRPALQSLRGGKTHRASLPTALSRPTWNTRQSNS
jgi:hypothetical protein